MLSIHFERRRGCQSFASISKLIGYCSMLHCPPCATIGHSFPSNVLLFLHFHPSCCSCFPSSLRRPHHYLYTPRHPSSSCYPHHHHPHYISSYSSPSQFFPSPFLHSPFLLYFIIHIWHHLRLAFFCNIMVICSFCITSDHIIILHLICDAKYVSILLLLSLL